MLLNIVIMCGGSGTRLWPLSRSKLPKQFLHLTDKDLTMFQITCRRIKKLNFNKLLVVCNQEHMFLVEKQLNELQINTYIIVGEPFGKNTARVIALSSCLLEENSNILVMSSDHIWDDELFIDCVKKGLELDINSIKTFGITPSYAEIGYGYINYNGDNLIKFVEKPNKELAKKYLTDGNYLWNSGNFIFHNKLIKKEFQQNANDILYLVKSTLNKSDTSSNKIILNKDYFNDVRSESFDYAIMENHSDGKIIKYDGIWVDIGSFKALYDYLPKDDDNNCLNGDIKCIDTTNCLVQSDKLVTTLGIDNLVVIDTKDTLLIADKERSQDVKHFVKQLKNEKRNEVDFHTKVFRPWGWYINIDGDDDNGSKVKRIGVYPGKRLSLQSHTKRSEHWVVVKGQAKVQVGEDFHILHKNQSIYIPVGVLHRMENIGQDNVEFIETQIGDYLGEDDIIRYQDDFGRV